MENTKYDSHSSRYLNYYPTWLVAILVLVLISFFSTFAKNADNNVFYVISFLFSLVFVVNFLNYKSRSIYYIKSYKVTKNSIILSYFIKNDKQEIEIPWNDLDFQFGAVKGDQYLVIWNKEKQIIKIYKSFATHSKIFSELKDVFLDNISKDRVKESWGITSKLYYTKRSGLF